MRIGDLVKKEGPFDNGRTGVIIEVKDNGLGHTFVTVMQPSGKIVTWYADLVRIIHESR